MLPVAPAVGLVVYKGLEWTWVAIFGIAVAGAIAKEALDADKHVRVAANYEGVGIEFEVG
jgi:hypothetical protein